MYSADTLAGLNSEADLRYYMDKNPLVRVKTIDDFKQAPDYAQVNMGLLERVSDLTEVDTLFVDNSGFGQPGEPAMMQEQFTRRMEGLFEEATEDGRRLFACLSGIGQFQVYVTILTDGDYDREI